MNDLLVSGSQSTTGGEFDNIRVSGSFHATGDVRCKSLHSSGSSNFEGIVDCEGEIHSSGTIKIAKGVKANKLENSGTCHFASFSGGDTHTSGTLYCDGDIKSKSTEFSGTVKCQNFEADTIDGAGRIACNGEINADRVYLRLASSVNSRAKSIVGSKITIKPLHTFIIPFHSSVMETGLIEGDEIEINYVEAETVRGTNVKIGKKCKINRLEYSGTADIDNGAVVSEVVKL